MLQKCFVDYENKSEEIKTEFCHFGGETISEFN